MAKKTETSFFQKLFSSLFSGNDPEAEKNRQLKQIAKNLSRSGYKFYKPGSDQVLPQFGKFFYDIYKIISPAQIFFQNQQNPNFYKNLVIDYSLTESQKKLSENFSEESILAFSKSVPFEQLKTKLKQDVETFLGDFDSDKISSIDRLYTKLTGFKAFCLYDFYFLLKKFDSTLREGEFNRTPKLEAIEGAYIAEDLKNFAEILNSLPLDEDWNDLMAVFKTQRGVEPVKPNQWNKIVQKLRQLRDSRVFDMIIQLTTKNPSYVTDSLEKQEHIVESFIEATKTQTANTLKKLESEQRNSKIDSLLMQIFNTDTIVMLKNYTESGSAPLERKNLGSFEYAKPLNYLKAFLVEFIKRDVREYADLVLIRGKWTLPELSTEMSSAYHQMLEASDAITQFDAKLNEEAEIGMKIKTLLPRADRDKESNNIIKTTLRDVNSLAREYLVNTTKSMISFAKILKSVIEDHKKPKGEIVMNWKELDRFAEHPINQLGVEVYKKIYLFVQLVQSELQ